MSQKFVVVDIETTGSAEKKEDKIIQIAAVTIKNGEITNTFSSFVQPNRGIPPFITELTGITAAMVADAPVFFDIAPAILSLLEGAYFVAHNVAFDWNFLQEELAQAGYEAPDCKKIDTVELARILLPKADSFKLIDLAKKYDLVHVNPHQADSDAYVTAELLVLFLEKLSTLPLVTLQSLQKLSPYLQSDLEDILATKTLEKMLKVNKDEHFFDVYHGIALRKRSFTLPQEEENIPAFAAFVENNEAFRNRLGQQEMMKDVYKTLHEQEIALIEGGTGVGKSLGYLLPSVFFAKETDQPVVISTKTIQLQHQLMEKEIPFIHQILELPWKVALLKGKNHYLCLEKFQHFLQKEEKNYDYVLTKGKLLIWLLETETGDVDELNLPSGGELIWPILSVDNHSRRRKNPWLGRCFYERAVKDMLIADVILTNHNMLLQEELLDAYPYVIIDEAHHLEEVASHVYGNRFFVNSWYYQLNRLAEVFSDTNRMRLLRQVEEIKFESDELFTMLYHHVLAKGESNDTSKITCLLQIHEEKWQVIVDVTERINEQLKNIWKRWQEVHPVKEKMTGLMEVLVQLVTKESADKVAWIELDTKESFRGMTLSNRLISVASKLKEQFFDKRKSVVLTSATLATENHFDYMKASIGLQDVDVVTKIIPSPFDYENQVALYVPTDMPFIHEVNGYEYAGEIALAIAGIAEMTKGRMLVLFTSQKMLLDTYEWAREIPTLASYALLAQGVQTNNRVRLTKQFLQVSKSILLGTTSFWEGIDLPGEELSCLVIVRLPFSPPTSPVPAAKIAQIEAQGGNPFTDYSLQEAILRFKQGFGRLIRHENDKGAIIVLDKRLTTKPYGKVFLKAIPNVSLEEDELARLLPKIEAFLK